MLSDAELSGALAGLSPEVRALVHNLMAHGWPFEAERVIADATGDSRLAKAIIAGMVRRMLTI